MILDIRVLSGVTPSALVAAVAAHVPGRLTIIEGDARQDQALPPGKVIDGVCQKGCIVRLNDSDNDEYELQGSEAVSVEEGFLYYDTPIGDGAPRDGSTKPPVEKKAK